MDLSFLDKSSTVTPLLVRLYEGHRLYGLAKDQQPEARAALTNAITELFDMELSPRESELVADVLIELVRQAQKDLRQALAERLSIMDKVPLRLVLQMANDEIDVAASVLKRSKVLSDLDLIYIIKSKGADYWRAIAQRKAMGPDVINELAQTRDVETAIALTKNEDITLPERAMETIAELAQDSEDLARPLLQRSELTEDIVTALYEHAGQIIKDYITQNHPLESKAINKTVDGLVFEMAEAAQDMVLSPTPAMLKAADKFKEKGLLTASLMLGTLRRGQLASFVAQFSRFAGLGPHLIEQVLMQTSGQGLAVVCKAFEISKPDFSSIYLLTNRVRTRGNMIDQKDMARAVKYYNHVDVETARKIVRDSLGGVADEGNV